MCCSEQTGAALACKLRFPVALLRSAEFSHREPACENAMTTFVADDDCGDDTDTDTDTDANGVSMHNDVSMHTEWSQLRMRVIALENLVISLLAEGSEEQRTRALEMAAYIGPRAGHTPHPLTLRAADEMRSLVNRACQFRAPSMP